jgi:uncharacterized damage-inducible protein DinB
MNGYNRLNTTIYDGWHNYQTLLTKVLLPLTDEQLALRASPQLRTIDEIARHIVAARAYWFYVFMGDGGSEFEVLEKWDREDAKPRTAEEIINGLERTWQGMQQAIESWSAEEWARTWPNSWDDEPEIFTRQWVIWHLIEHDLHHGGEISITLGANGIPGIDV